MENKALRPSRIPLPIQVRVSKTVMNYVSEKSMTLQALTTINNICRSHLSDHYMQTPGAIHHLGIQINGSTIKAYTPPVPSEICSFVKCVLPKEPKGIGTKIKNWIVFKLCQGRPFHGNI